MKRSFLRMVVLLGCAAASAACSEFVLQGPTPDDNTRRRQTPNSPTIAKLGDAVDTAGWLPVAGPELPSEDAAVQADAGVPPAVDQGLLTPDHGASPAPDHGAAPALDHGTSPAPDHGTSPAPDHGTSPAPDHGTSPAPDHGAAPACGNAFETEVLARVNAERSAVGKAALQCHLAVAAVARAYSQAMCDQRFFSHTGLDGTSPWDRIKGAGISYKAAGENIATGQSSPAAVMTSWMNSSGHKANILGDFTHLGVGYVSCPGGVYGHYWTQDFLRL